MLKGDPYLGFASSSFATALHPLLEPSRLPPIPTLDHELIVLLDELLFAMFRRSWMVLDIETLRRAQHYRSFIALDNGSCTTLTIL